MYASNMRVLRGVSFLAILALATVLRGGAASAAQVSVNGGQLEVQARVLPQHTVVIDEQGVITQIFSNTTEDIATPRVYRVSIEASNEQPLTLAVYDEYRRLVPPGASRIGQLYARHSILTALQAPALSPLPAVFITLDQTRYTLR